MQEPFFVRAGRKYQPTQMSRGPWNPKSLHGRVMIGLLGWEIERQFGGPDYIPARLTVDMYKLPELDPVEVVVRVVKDGRRLKVIDADYISNGEPMGRATCQLLQRTENPAGKIWAPETWDAPHPDQLTPPAPMLGGMFEIRSVKGGFGTLGQKQVWLRDVRPLVDNEPMTPFTRAALAADFASPLANSGDSGLGFINSDATLYLNREPRGEWVGFQSVNHQASDGVSVVDCLIYDVEGPIGSVSCCALAQRKSM